MLMPLRQAYWALNEELQDFFREFRQHGPAVKKQSRVGLMRQFAEIVVLRSGPGKLAPRDYYKLRVYRKDLPFAKKRMYVSNNLLASRAEAYWGSVAQDKLFCYSVLAAEGIAVPQVLAICHRVRSFCDCPALRNVNEVREYLASSARYPFIAKPIAGAFSNGFALLSSYDPASSVIRCGDGTSISLKQFSERCMSWKDGVLFQELLVPHPDIAAAFGPRLCTLRMIVVLNEDGPTMFRALLKIVAGTNSADNYWRSGNVLARLNVGTGEIEQCTTGLGPEMRFVEQHPDTGRSFKGFHVPRYREAVELTLRASRAFACLRMQAWDIAVTPRGPMALEVNDVGSLFIPQLGDQRGLYEASEFREYLARVLSS